jgi:protein-S-isoprenylcysteine O-methyltransferase Ste14
MMNYLPLILYTLLFFGLKMSERAVLTRPESALRKGWGDWTVWFILIPLWLVLIGPVFEFVLLGTQPEVWEIILGSLLYITAGFFSIKGYSDLQQGFIKGIEFDETSLVVTGLYKTIRHPISLGNILFCIACPVLLAAGPSWIPALVGVLGVMMRISIEESFIQQHVPDYAAYKKQTWALIPYIY